MLARGQDYHVPFTLHADYEHNAWTHMFSLASSASLVES